MRLAVSAGVNWIQTYGGIKIEARDDSVERFLSDASEYGLKVIANVEHIVDNQIDTAFLVRKLLRWREHPAIGAWQLVDEPEVKGITMMQMARSYEICKRLDPSRPVLVVWAPVRHLGPAEEFGRTFDWAAIDVYPVRRIGFERSVITSAVTELRAWLNIRQRPLTPIIQAFSDSTRLLPSEAQLTSMFDDFRQAGASSGVAFYAWNAAKNSSNLGATDLWPVLLRNIRQGRFSAASTRLRGNP